MNEVFRDIGGVFRSWKLLLGCRLGVLLVLVFENLLLVGLLDRDDGWLGGLFACCSRNSGVERGGERIIIYCLSLCQHVFRSNLLVRGIRDNSVGCWHRLGWRGWLRFRGRWPGGDLDIVDQRGRVVDRGRVLSRKDHLAIDQKLDMVCAGWQGRGQGVERIPIFTLLDLLHPELLFPLGEGARHIDRLADASPFQRCEDFLVGWVGLEGEGLDICNAFIVVESCRAQHAGRAMGETDLIGRFHGCRPIGRGGDW